MRRMVAMIVAGAAGVALAAVTGLAVATTFTLKVARDAKVVNATTMAVTHENIAVAASARAVYWLSGDSAAHPKCTKANGCFAFWPPLKAAKPTKAAGISGKLGTVHRFGITQVTLGGHPLYLFELAAGKRDVANGEDVHGFNGIWHVVTATSSGKTTNTSPTTSTMTTSTYTYPSGY